MMSYIEFLHKPAIFLPWRFWSFKKKMYINIFNISSGGTDIISCFMGQNMTVPVYRGEIQARNLGMAVESWNCEGEI